MTVTLFLISHHLSLALRPPSSIPPPHPPPRPNSTASYDDRGSVAGTCGAVSTGFDSAFRRFLRDNGYTGGSVAAVKDGRLVLAKGYGVTREGTEVKVGSRFPVSSLSKSLTAVAVLRLVQQGLLDLDDQVFGKRGILHMIHPLHPSKADPRLGDITVGHLLRHSAGWDQNMVSM